MGEPEGGELVCPRCRHRADALSAEETAPPSSAGASPFGAPASRRGARSRRAIPRCPHDGAALVRPEVLAEADGDPFLGMTIAGRFVIVGKLGAGSMGTVYRARQEAMGRDVALKILRSDRALDAHAKTRFTREALAMSQLRSPHTVTVFDFGEIDGEAEDPDFDGDAPSGGGSLYLAMELLEGESLGQRLKRSGRLGVAEAVRFGRHALLSLAEAHNKGIVHRDLKPDNLFLARPPPGEQEEVCKVLDFGIAKVLNDADKPLDALETQAGTVFGTPRYMSPEQAQGKALDARSDLYSLGVLLYQMLAGRPPFADADAVVVMARHIKSTPQPVLEAAPGAGIPRALGDLLQRVLAKRPDDRPASAEELIAAIDRAMATPDERDGWGRGGTPAAEAGATGELPAVVGDDLDASEAHQEGREPPRSRGALVAIGAGAAALVAAALAVGPLRPPGGAVRAAQARVAEEALLRAAAARRATEGAAPPARAASAAGAASSAPSAAPPVTPPRPKQAAPRKSYSKFD